MAVENIFQLVEQRGWRLGFGNLLARENRKWWGSNRWWMQALLWTGVLTGFLVIVLYVLPGLVTPDGERVFEEDPAASAVQGFFGVGAFALAIGITILMQDEITAEKQSGTAEWVLSKPASRSAFILAKLTAHTGGMLVVMLGIPAAITYAILSAAVSGPYPLLPFLAGVGLVTLHTFFYLTLTLMMGVWVERNGAILAVSLGALLGGSFIRDFLPAISLGTPWFLPDIAGLAALGVAIPPQLVLPILASILWPAIFIAVALWKFRRYEF